MSELEVRVADAVAVPAEEWDLVWVNRQHGTARLVNGNASVPVLVEGDGQGWVVTLRGRRIPVTVRTWRERLMAETIICMTTCSRPVLSWLLPSALHLRQPRRPQRRRPRIPGRP